MDAEPTDIKDQWHNSSGHEGSMQFHPKDALYHAYWEKDTSHTSLNLE